MEEEGKKTNRQMWEDNLRAKYPDENFDDEDALYAKSMSGYDEVKGKYKEADDKNQRFVEDNKKISEMLTQNPNVMNFIASLVSGESLPKSMSYLSDIMDLEEGTPEYDEYMKGVEEQKGKMKQADDDLAQYRANMEKTNEALKTFADKNGISEEDMVTFLTDITNTLQEKIFKGDLDEDLIEKFYRVFNYDKDMEAAKESGRVAGRNEAIKAKTAKKKSGDGLPQTSATGGFMPSEDEPMDDRMKQAESFKGIFGR